MKRYLTDQEQLHLLQACKLRQKPQKGLMCATKQPLQQNLAAL